MRNHYHCYYFLILLFYVNEIDWKNISKNKFVFGDDINCENVHICLTKNFFQNCARCLDNETLID